MRAARTVTRREVGSRPLQAPPAKPQPKPPDPQYVELLKRLNYMPEAVTDATTEFVLMKAGRPSNGTSPFGCEPNSRCTAAASPGWGVRDAPPAFEPLLLVIVMPWFAVHTGHVRAWTLLHRLRYPCLFRHLNMRMLVLVQPGELCAPS